MKKEMIAVLILLICSPIVMAAVTDNSRIVVTLVNQEPDPVSPGSYVDVRFKIENKGSDLAEDVTFQVLSEYPFSTLPGDNGTRQLGGIWGRQIGETGVLEKIRLKVDENAVAGPTDLNVRYKLGRYGSWITPDEFTINIATISAIIGISNIKYEPSVIEPGKASKVTVTLENNADNSLRQIVVSLDLTSEDIPIAPVTSTTEQRVPILKAGDTSDIVFDLAALPDADGGTYKVPVTITYTDGTTQYTKSGIIGLLVGSEPDMSIVVSEQEVYKKGQTGKITLTFTNKGLSDIKFLNVILKNTDYIEVIQGQEQYIGKIDSDDFESIEYTVNIKDKENGEVPLELDLEYRDVNNKKTTETMKVPLKVYKGSEARKFGLQKSNITGIIIIIVIVGGGYFLYRKWKKKKKAK